MTTCPQRELISDYVCGQLTADQRQEVEAHVAACPACASELQALSRLTTRLRAIPEHPAPDMAESVVNATIRARPAHTHAMALAASVAILLGGVWWMLQKEPPVADRIALATPEPEAAIEMTAYASAIYYPSLENCDGRDGIGPAAGLCRPGYEPNPRTAPKRMRSLPLAGNESPVHPIASLPPVIIEGAPTESPAPPAAPATPAPSAMDQAVAWLLEAQDPDGGWAMGRTGAGANYTVGLSALALLALISQAPEQETEQRHEAIQRGLSFLLAQQDADGLFGPDITGSLYNHTLACLTLLEGHTEPADGLHAGLALLIRHQRAEGGWSYLRARSSKPNSGLTTWALLALMQAEQVGVVDFTNEIARGVAWLETTLDEEGRVGYRRPGDHPHGSETLTAAAALCLGGRSGTPHLRLDQMLKQVLNDTGDAPETLDFYRTFFQATALREAGFGESPEMKQLLARLQAAQSREGEEIGSWASADPWAKSGGRVYSTALAVLALREL